MATILSLKPRWLLCLGVLGCLARPACGQYDPDWARHFRIGAMVGLNIKADFKTSGLVNIASKPGVYDDGYVHPPPSGAADDYTSNWGYESSSQVSGQSLIMHQSSSFTGIGSTQQEDGSAFPGLDMAYGGNLWYWKRVRIGWEFGFGFLPVNFTAHESFSGTVTRNAYSFNTGDLADWLQTGVVPPGYNGTAAGGPSIHSTPTPAGSDSLPGTITGTQTLDVMLYTFRLGPSFYWDFNRYLGMSMGAGPAVGIVSGDLRFNETIQTDTTAPNKGQVSGTAVVYGGYVSATLMYHAQRNGDIYLGAQYMPMGDGTISGAGHQGRLKLSGAVYISAGVNWPF